MLQQEAPFRVVPETGLASRRVEALFLLAVWLCFLILALRSLGPDSVYTSFHSDAAIPILMANDDRPVTIFDYYYYASDRWGGWPLMAAKVLHQNTGLHWTDQSLHYARTIWIFFGLLVLAALNARAAPAVIVSGLIVLCLEQTLRNQMFDLSQVYAWQLPALFLAWFCLRHLLAQRLRSDEAASVRAHAIFWSVAFYFCALLAIWSSVASAPFLAVLVTLETLRSRLLFQKIITKRRIGLAIVVLFAATASEFLIKKNYHRHSLKHFGNDFKTVMTLDFGHLYENLLRNWHNVVQFSFFPLIVVALCFVVGTVGLILYQRIAGKGPLLTRVFADETVTMVVALTAMAALNFVIMISVNHVRINLYRDRFQVPTYFFGAVSGLLVIYLAIRIIANRITVTRYVLPLVLVSAFIFLGVRFPQRTQSETYKLDRQTALALSERVPGAVLMGTYWETYIFAGLQPKNIMTPVPFEGALGVLNRIPWTPAILHDSPQVVIEYQKSGLVQRGSLPPSELLQYGTLLKLHDARFYENGPYAFALYFNERSRR